MKRSITLLLALLLLSSTVLSACGEPDSDATPPQTENADNVSSSSEEETPEEEEEEELDSLEARKNVPETLESGLDFGGATFQMLVQPQHRNDAWVDELTGNSVDDEVYARNLHTEELLNIDILESVDIYEVDIEAAVQASVLAGDNVYDLVLGHAIYSGSIILNDYTMNWYDVPHVNFENPWYPQESIANLTYKGQMYSAVSDMCLSLTKNTYCMFFDKQKAEDYSLGNMYDIVRAGDWTLDTLRTTVGNIYEDSNGNGERDEEDFYGFATDQRSGLDTYLWACDQKVMYFTDDDQVVVSYADEKTGNIIDKVKSLLNETEGAVSNMEHSSGMSMYFSKGHALFANGMIGQSATYLAEYENEFGIIPYPKYDENQKDYYTMVDGNFSVLILPKGKSEEDLAKIGAAVEAMSAYSWKNVIPKYYDVALKTRYARDQESVEMLDLLTANRVVDFAYIYDNFEGFVFLTEQIIRENLDFASTVAGQLKAKTVYYEKKVLKYFLENAE